MIAVAGFRIQENLYYGRYLYVDDLVTEPQYQSQGAGTVLLNNLREEAQKQHCTHLVLDTRLSNALAQRFYFRQGMLSLSMGFCQQL